MPADASIFDSYTKPPKSVIDYQNEYAKADQLRNQNAIQALTLQQQTAATAQSLAERNALQRIAASSGGDRQALITGMRNSGLPGLMTQADSLEQSGAKLQESQATAAEKTAAAGKTTQETQIAGHAQHLQALSTVNTPQDAVQWITEGVRSGALPAAGLPAALDRLQQASATPEGFAQWKRQTQQAGMTVQQQMELTTPKPTEVRLGDVVKTIDMNPRSASFGKEVVGQQQVGVSPDTASNNATSRANNADTIKKDYAVAGLNPDGSPKQLPIAVDGSLDLTKVAPEDLAAAQRYRTDGTLPPNMGRGTQGANESRRLRAIASALDMQAGDSPEDARVRQLALKGDIGAIANLRKREVAIGANVKNFDFNADQVLQLSGKVDRTGVPIINAWINAGRRSVSGNPELAAFDTAVKTTVNEFAQIVGGTTSGASTEGEKKKAEALLNAQQTPEQILSVINQMRIESKNRMQSFARQRQEMMPKNGASSAPQPEATAAAKTVNFGDLK